jgi:hypothetical protein
MHNHKSHTVTINIDITIYNYVEVVLRHFHWCRYWSSTAVVLLLEELRSPRSWLTGNTVDTKIYVVWAAGA